MPQPTRIPIAQRPQVADPSINVRGLVDANPTVHWGEPVAPQSKTMALASALTGVQPGLTKYLVAKQDEQNQQDVTAGEAARTAVGNVDSPEALRRLDPKQSASFQIGYMHMHASLEAAKKTQEMVADYQTSFNPDTDNIDDFLAKHLNPADYQGMDKSYLDTYLPAVQNAAMVLRGKYEQQVTDKVLQNRKDMIYEGAAYLAQRHAEDMSTPAKADVQTIYDAGQQMGLSKKDIEEQVFSAFSAASVSGNGNPRLLDYFFGNRADGSPGLAYTGNYGPHVIAQRDKAEQYAYSQYTRGIELQQHQQKLISDKVSKDLEDAYSNGKDITPLVEAWKPYLTADTYKEYRKLARGGPFEPNDNQVVADLDSAIRRGDADASDISQAYINNHINSENRSRLMSLAETVNEKGTTIQRSHETKSVRAWVSGSFPVGGAMDFDKAMAAKRDAALRDFDVAMTDAQTDNEAQSIGEKILRRYGIEPGKPAEAPKPIAAAALPNGSVDALMRETVRLNKAGLMDDDVFVSEMENLKRMKERQRITALSQPTKK